MVRFAAELVMLTSAVDHVEEPETFDHPPLRERPCPWRSLPGSRPRVGAARLHGRGERSRARGVDRSAGHVDQHAARRGGDPADEPEIESPFWRMYTPLAS